VKGTEVENIDHLHDHYAGEREGLGVGNRVRFAIPQQELKEHERRDADIPTETQNREDSGAVEDRLALIPRRTFHDPRLDRLETQRNRCNTIGYQVDPKDLHGQQDQRTPKEDVDENRDDLTDIGGQQVANEFLDVVVLPPALFDRAWRSLLWRLATDWGVSPHPLRPRGTRVRSRRMP
jgi:hypothetical protein